MSAIKSCVRFYFKGSVLEECSNLVFGFILNSYPWILDHPFVFLFKGDVSEECDVISSEYVSVSPLFCKMHVHFKVIIHFCNLLSSN